MHARSTGKKVGKSSRPAKDDSGLKRKFYDLVMENFPEDARLEFTEVLEKCHRCCTWEYLQQNRGTSEKTLYYDSDIGDCCYLYNKAAKERFFNAPTTCFLFQAFVMISGKDPTVQRKNKEQFDE